MATNGALLADPAEARQWVRTQHSSDLYFLVRGRDIWGKALRRSRVVKDEAARQLELRTNGAAKVRGCLKHLGHTYSGTGGWWIVPFVTPEAEIAFVNISHGIAVATDIQLDPDTIEALTVPDQGEGVKASGAAVWTSPDAGEGRHASSPPGWVQLVCDIRCADDWPVDETVKPKVRTVAYGLTTCYKDPGRPGRELDPGHPPPDPTWWHFTPEGEREVIRLIHDWMKAAIRQIVPHLPNAEDVLAALDGNDYNRAYALTNQYPDQEAFTADRSQERLEYEALRWLRAEAARNAATTVCKEFWVNKVYFARERDGGILGESLIDRFYGILTRIVYLKLIPVVESVRWCLDMSNLRNNCGSYGPHGQNVKAILGTAAVEIAKVVCHGLDDSARDLIEKKMVAVLYRNGPIYL